MTAREAILAALGESGAAAVALPDLPRTWPGARDAEPPVAEEWDAELVRRFAAMLERVGGRAVEMERVAATAFEPPADCPRRGVVSCVPGLAISTLTVGNDASRPLLDQIGLAVVPGRLGVAENGAVWVDERDLPHRALPHIAEHLAIVLARGDVVADMHEAYRRLRAPLPGYGVFISGPSKTADIEQALVIGAQGPKSLAVLLV